MCIQEYIFDTSLGKLLINGNKKSISKITLALGAPNKTTNKNFLLAEKELNLYFEGKIKEFSFKINIFGTPFQLKVWSLIKKIKYADTSFYSTISKKLSSSPRAVGKACSTNPCILIIPCHRVILQSGKLGGYILGSEFKKTLLKIEKETANEL